MLIFNGNGGVACVNKVVELLENNWLNSCYEESRFYDSIIEQLHGTLWLLLSASIAKRSVNKSLEDATN